jgi:ferrous iron transport protein A
MKKLSELEAGEAGIIHSFEKDELYIKLLEMGCLPGNVVELLQIAPFGDPLYLNINGCHLAIRLETACEIEVTLFEKGAL